MQLAFTASPYCSSPLLKAKFKRILEAPNPGLLGLETADFCVPCGLAQASSRSAEEAAHPKTCPRIATVGEFSVKSGAGRGFQGGSLLGSFHQETSLLGMHPHYNISTCKGKERRVSNFYGHSPSDLHLSAAIKQPMAG